MRYIELTENYSPEEDKSIVAKLSDTRTIRLTLRQLSKLRKIREYRKFQKASENEQVQKQYGGSSDEAPAGGGALDL